MARTNNRRNQPKGQQGGQTPSNWGSGKGKGKDKKKPIPVKANVFSSKKKLAPAFARNGNQPPGPKQQGKQHRFQAKERGGGAKKGVGRQKEFRFHLLTINTPSNSYQKAPWKPSAARPLTTNTEELETSGAPSLEASKLQSTLSPPRDHSASGTGIRSNNNNRRSICSRICSGPMPTEGIPSQLLDFLDQELEQFGAFVRLTPLEVQARNRVVGAVQRAAAQQYVGAQVQPFGSFATPEVCCFLSDIDLAVDGVVGFPASKSTENESKSKGSRKRRRVDGDQPGPKPPSSVDLKRERVKQWALALDSIGTANESSQGSIVGDVTAKAALQGAINKVECDEKSSLGGSALVDQQSDCSDGSLAAVSNWAVLDGSESDRTDCQAVEHDLDASKKTTKTSSSSSLLDEGSDQDSADKLSSLKVRALSNSSLDLNPSQENLTSLSSDTETEYDDGEPCDTSGMEVSMSATPASRERAAVTINKETRELCIDALKRIKRKLQKQVRMNRRDGQGCQLIKARVPILKLELPAFEVDVAIAGCNGADTAAYSGDQVARFRRCDACDARFYWATPVAHSPRADLNVSAVFSFAPVVLFLKILLHQNKLDVPFEGGLGSYKLYVLVAYHIEKHLKQGGTDRSGEVLLAFLFRYGKVPQSYNGESVSGVFRTHLSVSSTIESGGGCADLSNVYLIQNCLRLFDLAWHRLQSKFVSSRGQAPPCFLDALVDSALLRRERDQRMHFANLTLNTTTFVK